MEKRIKIIALVFSIMVLGACGTDDEKTDGKAFANKKAKFELLCSPGSTTGSKCSESQVNGKIAVLTVSEISSSQGQLKLLDKIKCEDNPTSQGGQLLTKCSAEFDVSSLEFFNFIKDSDGNKFADLVLNAFVDLETSGLRTLTLKRGDLVYQVSGSDGKILRLQNTDKQDIQINDVSASSIFGGWLVN